jgi:hypothetical protein
MGTISAKSALILSLQIGIGGNLAAPPSHTTGHTAPAVGAGVRVRTRRFGQVSKAELRIG